jgi:hypothetical protein
MHAIKENRLALLSAHKETFPVVQADRTESLYLMNRMQDNKFFGNISKIQMLGTTVTNQICISEEIKSKLNSAATWSRNFFLPVCCLDV